MTDLEQRKAAKEFAEYWKDKGKEKSQSQKFWISLLTEVYGVKDIKSFINFEEEVDKLMDDKTGWVDGYIPSTKVLIEQKSSSVELDQKIKHGDVEITAFQQAWLYSASFNYDDKPRWIVTCNFRSFRIYDMNNRNSEPEEVLLKNLDKEYYRLSFLADTKNEHVKKEEELSFKAGDLVGKLYEAFSKQYKDLSNEQSQKDLNELCVRIVFCLYAEDAGLFGKKGAFHDFLSKYDDLNQMRKALIELFRILDTPIDYRDQYLEDDLNQFPYVNGGLFSNENIEIPTFTEEIKDILLAKASGDFDWSEISPTIFGAVFESTLNPETRKNGGMHYTSIENIHKVIDPLFLNDLRDKLNECENIKNDKKRNDKLQEFQQYLSSLTFFDPACGSGNFLTETYLSLRRLENEAIQMQQGKGVITLDVGDQIKVSIQQFFGIEINDFAVKVAKTALWIAEAQMIRKTEEIINMNIDFLPLKSYDNIIEGNALRMDWNNIVLKNKCNYIIGNPPFYGARKMTKNQKQDLIDLFGNHFDNVGELDYVSGWYEKAADYMENTNIKAVLVSTNSITQGEQPGILWNYLNNKGINICYAYRTFRWDSEANIKAQVHCVIICFSYFQDNKNKLIYDNGKIIKCNNINGYLLDLPNVYVSRRSKPICNVSEMNKGSMPNDNGLLCTFSKDDVNKIVEKYPTANKLFRRIFGSVEFTNNKERYCLWLYNVPPNDFINIPPVIRIIEEVKQYRMKSQRGATNKLANSPHLFGEIRQPDRDYLVLPTTTTEKRRYIPIGYFKKEIIATNALQVMPNATLYDFGILESNVHMAWMRATTGRMKSDYQYSINVVYNNFPWPSPTNEQKVKIEQTAKMILEARAKYPNSTLSDMYGEHMYLYPELLKAHQENDRAVWEAYGKRWNIKSESDCVIELMKMYQKIVGINN